MGFQTVKPVKLSGASFLLTLQEGHSQDPCMKPSATSLLQTPVGVLQERQAPLNDAGHDAAVMDHAKMNLSSGQEACDSIPVMHVPAQSVMELVISLRVAMC